MNLLTCFCSFVSHFQTHATVALLGLFWFHELIRKSIKLRMYASRKNDGYWTLRETIDRNNMKRASEAIANWLLLYSATLNLEFKTFKPIEKFWMDTVTQSRLTVEDHPFITHESWLKGQQSWEKISDSICNTTTDILFQIWSAERSLGLV